MDPSQIPSINSDSPPRSSQETMRPKRRGFHQKKEERQNPVADLRNMSSSAPGASPPTKDEENLQNQEPTAGSSEYERYAGLMHPFDMMEGSFKYARLPLTQRIPGSVARGRVIAASRLRNLKIQQLPFRGRSKYTETSAELVPGPPTNTIPFVEEEDEDDEDDEPSSPIGKWRCCKCGSSHDVYSVAHGQHPVRVLTCNCMHGSCSKCTLEGLIKQFVPMMEPEVVHLSEDVNKAVRFGVFCDGCGQSWRAQKVHDDTNKVAAVKAALTKITAIPKRLNKRDPHPLKNMRASRSMDHLLHPCTACAPMATSKSVLNLRALSNEMQKEHGEQAELVSVRFTGIKCDCGMITDSNSLCFQIVDPPRDFYRVQFMKQMAGRRVSGFGTTPEDKVRGHGTPILVLRGYIRHPNPLMSSPVA
ncbi:hypothetical protein COCMIDRAFT_8416 [Bipolaris oryzae ATCC 44560]|uniref:Probable double zinc ribbon domain-containing protein n=1 Tax=Bipolaris oryzae ATCC 44560 TaxID=930090 RepID=W6YWR4_COCMI|nr:uncharacterized protein COCMIDRAFT_8416 [Bipolaris oryzae ATCC 44560]EUC41963.1 hypothetical protein COCMIDRAFT_8416 [Bipolaris oryzae ATCC 44560]